MSDDEIIRMANEAGWDAVNLDDGFGTRLKRFTELARRTTEPVNQPEPLPLADWLEQGNYNHEDVTRAAAELRRLHAECDALRAEVEELDQLRNRMSELLTATAEALRGPPAPQSLHDWSSIPDRTAAVVNALCGAMELAIEQCAERDALKATIRHLCEETRRIEAERDALRADAERYRWLRDPANAYRDEWNYFGPYSSEAEIDAAIDAAREAK